MKKILITGANSYIGTSFEKYIKENYPNEYTVDTVDMIDGSWREKDFSGYDSVFHVAGIAHIKETKKNAQLYYDINRDLPIEVAEKAKGDGVRQFLFLSSMSVYGMETGIISKGTIPYPQSNYGKSKLQAEESLWTLRTDGFTVAVLRPPMVYGKGCKGNYQTLRSFALKCPVFPNYKNERSMIYIGNLCAFIKDIIDQEKDGLFFPQNADYVSTAEMVLIIAHVHNKRRYFTKLFNGLIRIMKISIVKKVFGDLTYERMDTINTYSLLESIELTEK